LTTPIRNRSFARASPSGDATKRGEVDVRQRLARWGWLGAAVVVTALLDSGRVMATPPVGFTSTPLTKQPGRFGEIDVFNHFIPPNTSPGRHMRNVWLSWQKTKGLSDLYVQSNLWGPGGSTGWHSHPGHSLIIVTAGTVTVYEGNDPDCEPHVYTPGMGFVDPGGDHVHLIRNEDPAVEARTIAVQLIPANQPRRIDAADPGNCHF
jgi:hypothetical protein